jgi:hypothetical protein
VTDGWFNVPAALVAKWMKEASQDPTIKPVRVIYATRATPEEMAELKAERKAKERRGPTRVGSIYPCVVGQDLARRKGWAK